VTERQLTPLLDLDPDLGQLIGDERRAAARAELQVRVHRLGTGVWDVSRLEEASPEHFGLLMLEGVVAREILVSDTVSTELLGPGDVLRPWAVQASHPLLQLSVRWNALTESRLAILDRAFAARLSHWPEVNSVLIDRLNERAQRLATNQAISQLNRVDRRIVALFWHLAERWGRVTGDGVAVPLTLSHRMLGQLVGARRPTVSTAIGELARREELVRRADGSWLLRGQPTGLPTVGVERVVPIRRHLLGRDDETAGEDALAAPATREQPRNALPELRETLARLRADAQTRVAERDEGVRASAERRERVLELRHERRRRRRRTADSSAAASERG
jgi:hypothetical protein